MTENIKKVQYFLKFLLNTTEIQARSVLKTLTDEQTKAISEIFYNINYLNLNEIQTKVINQNSEVVRKLTQKNLKLSTKSKIISRRSISVYKILLILKSIIITVLKQ